MSGEIRRLVRRGAVLAMTVGVVAAGVVTVGIAAQWRTASAPLDTAPVAMTRIEEDLSAEVVRADNLSVQVSSVALEIATLRAAVAAAEQTVAGDAEGATALQAKLDKAKSKYDRLLAQLQVAKERLDRLNAAAARQAAINRAASQASSSTRSSSRDDGDEEDDEDDDEEDDEDEHDD